MSLHFPKNKRPVWAAIFLSFVLLLGISIGYLTNHVFSENAKFEKFTDEIFKKEVAGSSLTLHYCLAKPEKLGIRKEKATLGTISADYEESYRLCGEYEEKLKQFTYSRLSRENQLTCDMLLLYFDTQKSLKGNELLEEVLGPNLGVQAQLPILLAEYAFYKKEDITDYLNLLTSVEPYFESILAFEQEKSEAGYFMSDATLNRILEQCQAFIQNPDSNYMLDIFSKKLQDMGCFSREEEARLNAAHKKILLEKVLPAYEKLMEGLKKLAGTGKSSRGLAYFQGGKAYYLYLLKSRVGSYLPVEDMEKRLISQMMADTKQITRIFKEHPRVMGKLSGGIDLPEKEPEEMVKILQEKMGADFPEMEEAPYEIRYVHPSMEEYLSPAFYLTPPLDTGSPNVIYINRSGQNSNLELFATLAHEGFPGHLYQTVFFGRGKPGNIRYLIDSGGYVEGWATYVETFGYQYAASLLEDEDGALLTQLTWLNRSVNLCIYSLMDIGIHYRGWDLERCAAFLKAFGIRDGSVVEKIYQYIVETPANYLKYYWGYLNFLDLRRAKKQELGEKFDLKEFHRQILEIGPVQFPVLAKYILNREKTAYS